MASRRSRATIPARGTANAPAGSGTAKATCSAWASHSAGADDGSGNWSSFPQDLRHRLALGELVDELVQVADVAHQRVGNVFDADAADHAPYLGPGRVEPGLAVEGLEVGFR